jgi:hypothetical protein
MCLAHLLQEASSKYIASTSSLRRVIINSQQFKHTDVGFEEARLATRFQILEVLLLELVDAAHGCLQQILQIFKAFLCRLS